MVGTVVIVGRRKDKVSAYLDLMFSGGDKKRVCVCVCVSVYVSDNDKSSEEKSKIRDKE